MVALYSKLHETMSQHVAWRVAFAVVPVPILLFVAALVLIFVRPSALPSRASLRPPLTRYPPARFPQGTDHPTGKWANRHTMPATAVAIMQGQDVQIDASERAVFAEKKQEPAQAVQVAEVDDEADARDEAAARGPEVNIAVNQVLTLRSAAKILTSPLTWLPALGYMTTFGFELAVDSNLGHDLLLSHQSLGMLNAGYLASVFGASSAVPLRARA